MVDVCPECGQPFDAFPFIKKGDALMDPQHVMCDICGEHEHPADMTPDWNGETGCHLSCEEDPFPHGFTMSPAESAAAVQRELAE